MKKLFKSFLFLLSSILLIVSQNVQANQELSFKNINYYKTSLIKNDFSFINLKVGDNCFVKISENWLRFSPYVDNIVASWTGECQNGKPQGFGALRWWKEGSM